MKLSSALALALALAGLAACDRPAPPTPIASAPPIVAAAAPERVNLIDLSPKDGDLPSLLRREAVGARQKGLKPFIEVGATWCGPCNAIRASLGDPLMVAAFRGTRIIRLDLDAWVEKLPSVGIKPGSVPVFLELDANGRPSGRTITGDAWEEDVPANMAPKLKAFFAG